MFETIGTIDSLISDLMAQVERIESVFGVGVPTGTDKDQGPSGTIPGNLVRFKSKLMEVTERLNGVLSTF